MPHRAVDIAAIGCDFYAFTGHKMCGPTGTGALWARREHLAAMPPFIGGGEMIREVRFEGTVLQRPAAQVRGGHAEHRRLHRPRRGGRLPVRARHGERSRRAKRELLAHATEELDKVDGLRIFGRARDKAAVISFLVEGAHAHDLATLLDLEGVAMRSGHHCAHPLMQYFGVPATCRASFAFYNTHEEIDAFVAALHKVRSLLA